jgi:hypothetical protein
VHGNVRRTVPTAPDWLCLVNFNLLAVIDICPERPLNRLDVGRERIRATRSVIVGNPDQAHISTSLIERQNLTMRMSMRRCTRLTNAFSKKVENLRAAVSLHFAHYNFVRVHRTLRVTPAMEAGVTQRLWLLDELVERVSA